MTGTQSGERQDLVAVGSAVVDRYRRLTNLPEPDGGAHIRETRQEFGGVAANVACTAARLGHEAGVVTRLGTGEDGTHRDAEAIRADLDERGVDTARVRRGEERGTYSTVLVGPDGRRMVLNGGESVPALRLGARDWPYLERARTVVTSAYAPDAVVADLLEARAEGSLSALAFDLSGALSELEGRGVTPATVDEAVATADLVVAGDVALRSYCSYHGVDASPGSVAAALRERGVRRAALTRGPDGVTLLTPDRTVGVDALDVDVVDTTGAGDAFTGALTTAWLLGDHPPARAGRFAAAVAGLNCTARGARGGLPTREAVRAALDRRGTDP